MVSRRRDSLGKLDGRLKTLAKKLPQSNEQFTVLLALGDPSDLPESDRTAAIVAAQFVEYALQKAIENYLVKGFSEKEIFDGPGAPLGTFAAKIAMASALGIIRREECEDLDTIRAIRNAFAHSMIHIAFTDGPVADLVDTLHGYEPAMMEPEMRRLIGSKKVFVAVSSMIYFSLITRIPKSQPQAVWMPTLP